MNGAVAGASAAACVLAATELSHHSRLTGKLTHQLAAAHGIAVGTTGHSCRPPAAPVS